MNEACMLILAAAPGGAGADASLVEVQSIWDFILKGGFMMIPIGVCSLIAMAVMIERIISLRREAVIPPAFLKGLKKGLKGLMNLCLMMLKY